MKVRRRFKNMNIFRRTGRFSAPRLGKQILVSVASLGLLFGTWPQNLSAYQDAQPPAPAAQASTYTQQTPEQIQQLVAPIALYPDSLVAQILAASTFPEQVVEADRWVQGHPDLKGEDMAKSVDQEPWDPSVKALTAFPSVLGNMDKNLSWTSSLGDAYYNQQQDVMDAVQVMRQKAQQAGNLKSTPQQTVTTQGSTVEIQPAAPDVVYVPAYDPWLVYGYPIAPWPGWYPYPGIWFGGPYLSFGLGFGIGYFGGFGWGWGHWGFDWGHRYPIYGGARYYSRSTTFYNRNNYLPRRRSAWRICGPPQRRWQAWRRQLRRTWRSLQPSRRNDQAFQRKQPGCSRIRGATRPDWNPVGRIQRLWPGRTSKELLIARKLQLRWWRVPRRRWRIPWRRWSSWWRRTSIVE